MSAISIDGVLKGGARYRVSPSNEVTDNFDIIIYNNTFTSFEVMTISGDQVKAINSAIDVLQGNLELVRPVNIDMNFNPVVASNRISQQQRK